MINIDTVATELDITEPGTRMMAGCYAVAAYRRKHGSEPGKAGNPPVRIYPADEHGLLVEALLAAQDYDFTTVARVMIEETINLDSEWLSRAGKLAVQKYKARHGRRPTTGPFPFTRAKIYQPADRDLLVEALLETKEKPEKQPKPKMRPKVKTPRKPKKVRVQPAGYSSLASWRQKAKALAR
jgi:hypothetical protein